MTPKILVIAVASLFVLCVAAALAFGVEQARSLRITGAAVGIIFMGLAVSLAVNVVRGSVIDRWVVILAATAGATGIYFNAGEAPATRLVILGVSFSLCAIGLVTPFAGRHFAKGKPAEQDVDPGA